MALAQELQRRGHSIHLMTDHRVTGYGDKFPAEQTHIVPSATPSVRDPVKFVTAGVIIAWGVLAASLRGVPGVLHEQNAVMGRANRALARTARVLALSFAKTQRAEGYADRSVFVGNPVRDRVRAVADTAYFPLGDSDPFRLLVFGGSQGARAFAELVPPAIAELPAAIRARLRVTQQCRPEDLDRVAQAYRQAKVNVELNAFFDDLPERIAQSHLVIARAGASTVAELTVIGRPAILVPLPGSIDADQRNNALVVEAAGGGWVMEQATLSPHSLGTRITALFSEPQTLQNAARAAKSLGQPAAVEKLADIAEALANRGKQK
jgi:UDP-N-acetylglucosamine--N-acetylmuramyl-(pentapeptide) pyrophosphoryl-undecaprenol N-acetylglucosamine transferase